MVQTFNPEKVMLRDSLNGEAVMFDGFNQEMARGLKAQSKVVELGQRVEMGNQYILNVNDTMSELSDGYVVGEAEKIGVANLETAGYTLETRKIGVILPVSQEFLTYTWSQYFTQVVPFIVDKFAKIIDAGAFFGLYKGASQEIFGSSVLSQASAAGNVIDGDITNPETIYDLEALVSTAPNAFFGERALNRSLRGLVDPVGQNYIFDRNGTLDGLPYHELLLTEQDAYPEGTLIVGDTSGIKYGLPQGTGLRLAISNQATLSKVQNVSPDTGDVHMFEQDMQALRAIFEIAVAIPDGSKFAVLQPAGI